MYKYKLLNNISGAIYDVLDSNYQEVDDVAEADAIVVRSAGMHKMKFPESLEAIVRAGSGVNNIPLERCADRGIVVFNAPGANANSVKELVIASMINASRNINDAIDWVRDRADDPDLETDVEKGKKKFAGGEIKNKTLGVIGLGSIGGMVANTADVLGMDVIGVDPFLSVHNALMLSRNIDVKQTYDDIYKDADFITIHLHLTDETRGMINDRAFAHMKDGVVLLNFSRGEVVDNKALKKALESGKVRKYVTDFPSPEVMTLPNVIATPHLGASTKEAEDNCAIMAVRELRDYLENGNITNSVNFPNCDAGRCTTISRVTVAHHNVPNMLSSMISIFAKQEINIAHLINQTKGEYAYCIFDLDAEITPETIEQLKAIKNVIKVRVIK